MNTDKKQISQFKLKGLSRPKSMTCEPLDNENIFWPIVDMPIDRFNALWDYFKGDCFDKKLVEIEHDGLYKDGTPINGIVKSVLL